MMLLRRIILALPVFLLAFFLLAFLSVRQSAPKKLNQYVFGSIGEPDTLNPILSTTASASEVESRVFNGLVQLDENLELEGELARSWSFTQNSRLYFTNETDARTALEQIRTRRNKWPEIKLVEADCEENAVRLTLDTAGTGYQEQLLSWLGSQRPKQVAFLQVDLDTEKVFEDNTGVTATETVKRIKALLAKNPDLARRVIYYWRMGTSGYFEICVYGEPELFISEINSFLHAEDEERAIGECALKWEPLPALDEPVVIFSLREGVRWHDGAPFTSADVLFTYQALMDENVASPRRSSYEDIRFVEAPDDYTVRVVYKKPYSPALLSWAMDVLPKHILDGKDTQWWAQNFNRTPVGTGPYLFESWETNQIITMRKNPDYWEGSPHLDRIVIRFIPDPLSLRLSFETGEIDILGVEPHALGSMRNNPDYSIFTDLAKSYSYAGWNLKRPLFQDRRVRLALAHAVNIPDIIKYVLYGQGVQCRGIYHPSYWWANNDLPLIEYNPERARALLKEAGWTETDSEGYLTKNGERFEFKLITNQGNEIRKDVATLIQNDLKHVGIKVEVEIYEWAVFITQKIDEQDFDACVLGWTSPADYDQYEIWHSSQAAPGKLNFVSYKNPEVDRLIEKTRSEFDPELIKKYCHELQAKIYEDQPYLFLYVAEATTALHKGSFRVRRPDGKGGWIDEPIRKTKAGMSYYDTWWYRQDQPEPPMPQAVP